MEFLKLQAMEQKQQQMPASHRALSWLAGHAWDAARTHVLPRIPVRVYVAGGVLASLLALLIVVDAFPRLRVPGMLAVGAGGALAGYWRARSRRWLCALGIGIGCAWTLWAFTVAAGAGLVMTCLVVGVYALIGIERKGVDPGRLVAEWGSITSSPRSPLRLVLEGSTLHLDDWDGETVSYTLTLASGRTIDEALKVRAKIESAADRIFPVQKGSLQMLADHDSPSTVHMTVEMRAASPTEGGEEERP